MKQPTDNIRRYVIVELTGTLAEALDIATGIEEDYEGIDVHVFGCDICGCQGYLPTPESCDDELCGHKCAECECAD